MAQMLVITFVAVAIVVLLLGVRVFFTKRWGFPNKHVDGNKALTDKGLKCYRSQATEMIRHKNLAERVAMHEGE